MRDPKRIDVVLQEISNIWHAYPDLRLGQLISNVLEGPSLYYVEDDGLIQALKDLYKNEDKPVTFDTEAAVWELVKKAPGELGFILQAKTYEEYLATYTEIGGSIEDAVYSAEEFNILKSFFGDEE